MRKFLCLCGSFLFSCNSFGANRSDSVQLLSTKYMSNIKSRSSSVAVSRPNMSVSLLRKAIPDNDLTSDLIMACDKKKHFSSFDEKLKFEFCSEKNEQLLTLNNERISKLWPLSLVDEISAADIGSEKSCLLMSLSLKSCLYPFNIIFNVQFDPNFTYVIYMCYCHKEKLYNCNLMFINCENNEEILHFMSKAKFGDIDFDGEFSLTKIKKNEVLKRTYMKNFDNFVVSIVNVFDLYPCGIKLLI